MRNVIEKLKKNRTVSEEGLTLIEIVGVIAILGILTAISVPIFNQYQAELASVQDQTNLQQAAILVEQEAIDNNGLFPTYLPNEILSNPDMEDFVYTYSTDRTAWCLQGDSPSGKLFISSENPEVNRDVCTQDNIGAGSQTPWDAPTVPTPVVTAGENVWSSNTPHSTATVTWTPVTCPLADDDVAEWSGATTVTYSVRVLNQTRTTPVINPTNWSNNTTATINLTGWLPDDEITYSVRARCTINSGVEYNYNSPYSPNVSDIVDTFTVTPVAYSSTPTLTWAAGDSSASYQASWETGYCPVGTMQYRLLATNANNVTHNTGWVNWTNSRTQTLPDTFTPGVGLDLNHYVGCSLEDGRRYSSAPTTVALTTPLQPPAAPAGLTSNNAVGVTTVIPNRVVWNAVTCTAGTAQYNLFRTLPSAVNTGWVTFRQLDQELVAGTTYAWYVQARCVSGSLTSATSVNSTTHTVTAQFNIPPTPAVPAGLRSDANGGTAFANDRVLWNAVSCATGASAEYQIQQYMINGNVRGTALSSSWTSGLTLVVPEAWNAYGSTLGFQVRARCVSPGGTSPSTAWSTGHTFTTTVPAPATPGSVRNNTGATMLWNAVTCPTGTTAEYSVLQTRHGNSYTVTTVSDWVANITTVGLTRYNQGYPMAGQVAARCAGPNADSAASAYGSTAWTSGIAAPSVWTDLPAIRTGRVVASCASGTSGSTPRVQLITSNGTNRGTISNWTSGSSWTGFAWGSPNATLNGWARCATTWATSGDGFGTSKQ